MDEKCPLAHPAGTPKAGPVALATHAFAGIQHHLHPLSEPCLRLRQTDREVAAEGGRCRRPIFPGAALRPDAPAAQVSQAEAVPAVIARSFEPRVLVR